MNTVMWSAECNTEDSQMEDAIKEEAGRKGVKKYSSCLYWMGVTIAELGVLLRPKVDTNILGVCFLSLKLFAGDGQAVVRDECCPKLCGGISAAVQSFVSKGPYHGYRGRYEDVGISIKSALFFLQPIGEVCSPDDEEC